MEKLWTITEVCDKYKFTRSWVCNQVRHKAVKCCRVAGSLYFDSKDIKILKVRWLDRRK